MTRHPTRRRLQRWLDTGGPRRVDVHIEGCADCQGVLEKLSELDDAVVTELQTVTTPPDDLGDRTNSGVDSRLRDEAAAGAFLDLFTIGWDVMRTVLESATAGDATQTVGVPADGDTETREGSS